MQTTEETTTTKKQTKTTGKKKSLETKLEENNVNLIVEEEKNVEQNDNIQLQNENTNDSDIDLDYNVNEFLSHVQNINNAFQYISKKTFKNYDFTSDQLKDLMKLFKDINKNNTKFNENLLEFLLKEHQTNVKKDSKKKPKKEVDKDKCAINIKHDTYPEILHLMGLEEATQVSKSDILKAINADIKFDKINNKDILIEGKNMSFKTSFGKSKEWFKFIKSQMHKRGKTDEFPEESSYKSLMGYISYCLPPVEKKS